MMIVRYSGLLRMFDYYLKCLLPKWRRCGSTSHWLYHSEALFEENK